MPLCRKTMSSLLVSDTFDWYSSWAYLVWSVYFPLSKCTPFRLNPDYCLELICFHNASSVHQRFVSDVCLTVVLLSLYPISSHVYRLNARESLKRETHRGTSTGSTSGPLRNIRLDNNTISLELKGVSQMVSQSVLSHSISMQSL